jgi:hypothetical protein
MSKETDKWVCDKHDQKDWYCIKDAEGYEWHMKAADWMKEPIKTFDGETKWGFIIPTDKPQQ